MTPKSCADNLCKTKNKKRRLRGSFITHINGEPVFSVKGATNKLKRLYQEWITIKGAQENSTTNSSTETSSKAPSKFEFNITFAPEEFLQERNSRKQSMIIIIFLQELQKISN